MWSTFTLLCLTAIVVISNAQTCPNGKSFQEKPCIKKCSNLNEDFDCPPNPNRGCECNNSKFETNNGTCVNMFDCPTDEVYCPGVNEIYSFDHPCPRSCVNQKEEKSCPKIPSNRCDCREGYLRNVKNECVRPAKCVLDVTKCQDGFVPKCGNGEIPSCNDYAYSYFNIYGISVEESVESNDLTKPCNVTCQCPDGEYFDESSKKCVPGEYCRRTYGTEYCQRNDPNSVYLECVPSFCWFEMCTADCNTGCFCIKGYAKDASGKCTIVE